MCRTYACTPHLAKNGSTEGWVTRGADPRTALISVLVAVAVRAMIRATSRAQVTGKVSYMVDAMVEEKRREFILPNHST